MPPEVPAAPAVADPAVPPTVLVVPPLEAPAEPPNDVAPALLDAPPLPGLMRELPPIFTLVPPVALLELSPDVPVTPVLV
jgi:hypothetical protein